MALFRTFLIFLQKVQKVQNGSFLIFLQKVQKVPLLG